MTLVRSEYDENGEENRKGRGRRGIWDLKPT
jgi:hypothetical protein